MQTGLLPKLTMGKMTKFRQIPIFKWSQFGFSALIVYGLGTLLCTLLIWSQLTLLRLLALPIQIWILIPQFFAFFNC